MAAFHLPQGSKTSNIYISYEYQRYEWAMKNLSSFSSHLPPSKDQQKQSEFLAVDNDQEKARCDWDFSLSTVISVSSTANATVSDTLGVIIFDPSNTVVATGGIARKIRIYSLNSLLLPEQKDVTFLDHINASNFYICTPAKLSSLRWKPDSGSRILGSGDYDGVVTEYDLENKQPISERDEHGGRRVWSVDYSPQQPFVGASGSDDGTMQMWDTREAGGCVAKVQPTSSRSSVCCVEFNPFSGGGTMVAVGCADRKAYAYDVRRISQPLHVYHGHSKTVTYVKFFDAETMVSSSTDGCLKLWNINDSSLIRTYKGHVNSRSFVGLSVWSHGGLLVCGSEDNKVFVYDKRWGEPIWAQGFEPPSAMTGAAEDDHGHGHGHGVVTSVCWRQVHEEQCTLLAGGSNGVLQVFIGTRNKPLI